MLILLNMLKAMLVQNLVLTQTSKTKIACVWDLMFVSIRWVGSVFGFGNCVCLGFGIDIESKFEIV